MRKIIIPTLVSALLLISCESEQAKKERLAREEQQRIEYEQQRAEEEKAENIRLKQERIEQAKQAEADRIEREIQLEKERVEQENYNKYISNSLNTGATPYARYYGGNSSCNDYGCSQIKVRTSNSDVLVTIKKNDKVVRHAFIQAGDSYTFSFPNGTYQAFFYYGKGWNPEKEMKNGELKGGFIANEDFGKDDPQYLSNNVLEYELIMQQNGNFSTRPSNPEEAL
ncbi:hypothetical protein HX017_06700 [Myroides marinus]|uniref:hypothetical protein n=1 Tax=Flavobacteriales TaxID=200644 RepID=UPI000BFE2B99|nr:MULTISPECIES: hypothetical protein [Flavobacteriales]ATN06650.1 hypothetical protein CRN76_15205 [Chryseobacterium indologenes]MDM1347401.1 hypothetical protein [Myroides marinus]MDM1353728.1 hypothetical protein [Myroides marinus]MDM1364636.1 hypothetical protein [Myroides marinus]MDM1370842.1 hypothetical protein [Myroides marinus]